MFYQFFGWFHQWQRMTLCLFHHEHLSSRFKFTTQVCHVLSIHNIAVNKNKLAMNFSSSFCFHVKKSNFCSNLAFGGILNRHGHFKHTVRAQGCSACGRWTLPCHTAPISHGSTAISEKNPLHFCRTCIFTFRISLVCSVCFPIGQHVHHYEHEFCISCGPQLRLSPSVFCLVTPSRQRARLEMNINADFKRTKIDEAIIERLDTKPDWLVNEIRRESLRSSGKVVNCKMILLDHGL
jgi:hypothetical protein